MLNEKSAKEEAARRLVTQRSAAAADLLLSGERLFVAIGNLALWLFDNQLTT